MRIRSKYLAVGVVAIVALSLGAEGALRLRESRHATTAVQVRYYRHRRTQRALVRNADYHGVVRINSRGFRGPEVATDKAPGTTRIMVIGASTTFDPCAGSDSLTWAARLQHWLGELAPGRRFEVINAGMAGVDMLDQVIRLQSELYVYAPDVFVIYAGHGLVAANNLLPQGTDSLGPDRPNTPNALPAVTPWGAWLSRHSYLYQRVVRTPAPASPASLDSQQWSVAVENASGEFRHNLRSFVAIARGLGARVVLVEIARVTGGRTVDQFTAGEMEQWRRAFHLPPEVIHEGYRRFHDIWRNVADSVGATFVPAATLNISGPEHFCRLDPIHFNAAGSEAMGRRLAELLVGGGIVGR